MSVRWLGGVPCPTQPGECDSALLPFLSPSMLSGAGAQSRKARDGSGAQGVDVLTLEVLVGLRELLGRLEKGAIQGGTTVMLRDIPGTQEESALGAPANSTVMTRSEVPHGSGGADTAEKLKEDK